MKIENLEEAYKLKGIIQNRLEYVGMIKNGHSVVFTLKGENIPLTEDAKECLTNEVLGHIQQEIDFLSKKLERLLTEE